MSGSLLKILIICGYFMMMPLIGNQDIADAGQKWRENRKRKKRQKAADVVDNVQGPAAEEQAESRAEAGKLVESRLAAAKFVEIRYEESRLTELAQLCKMGDIIAMIDMAYYFRDRCSEPLRQLLDAYELRPVKENEFRLIAYLGEHPQDENTAEVYMMWLVRAALYGNEEAQMQIDRCPAYKWKAYIPYRMLTGEGSSFIKFWSSASLWKMGLIDMERGRTDCSLLFNMKRGYFVFEYVSDYEPPDEDGFGAEWEYEDIYYDEFFCRIPTKSKEEISQQQLILEKARDVYWQDPAHDALNRRYRRRCKSKQEGLYQFFK